VLALALVLVPFFAANEGFVGLKVAAHVAIRTTKPRLADALREKPC
jgi:hypothetical protein